MKKLTKFKFKGKSANVTEYDVFFGRRSLQV